jgi:hypothetical protein
MSPAKLCTGSPLALREGSVATTGEGQLRPGKLHVGVVEEQWRQHLAQMPFDMIGEHAQKDMCPNSVLVPVPDRPDFEVDRLHRPERPLHPR